MSQLSDSDANTTVRGSTFVGFIQASRLLMWSMISFLTNSISMYDISCLDWNKRVSRVNEWRNVLKDLGQNNIFMLQISNLYSLYQLM